MTEELKIFITAQIDDLKSELNKGKKEVEDFGKKGKVSFEEFNEATQKVGDVSKKALAVTAGAIAAAGAALLALASSTKEYRENQAKLNTAFEAAGATATEAKNTYNDLYRVIGDDDVAVEAANHLAKLTTNQQDLSQWTNICQGVFATFGDSLPIEGLTEAANETARVGAVTGPLADALNWAGVSEDAFNEKLEKCATTQEREALIRETLNGLYSEAAAGYEKNAADILKQNEAQMRLNEATGKLGAAIAPVQAALTELVATIAEKVAPQIQAFMDEHGEKIKQTLEEIATGIGKVISFIVDNWELVSTLGTIILAIAAALSVFSTVMGIVNAVMLASPVTWIVLAIVAAVAALVAIIILCIKHWDDIKAAGVAAWEWIKKTWDKVATWFNEKVIQPIVQFFTNLWSKITEIFGVVKEWFSEKFNAAKQGITNAFSTIGDFFSNIWSKITGVFSKVGSWFKEQFQNAVNNVKNVFSSITNFFSGIWNSIKSIFSNVGSAIGGAITNTVKSAINGVLSTATKIINGFISAINVAISVINAIPGVNIKKLSQLSVPKLAEGGIVDSATLAVVGEQGKEAIVPLENNTEWIDKIADKLGARQGNTPVILQVDGKTFAETSINTINALTRQTGSLKLNLV